jgi:CheY-like chemotaxis protein
MIASDKSETDIEPSERLAWDALMLATDFQQLPPIHRSSDPIQSKYRKTKKPAELVIPPYKNRIRHEADSNACSRMSRLQQTQFSTDSDERLEAGIRRPILPKLLRYTQEMAVETEPFQLHLCRRPSILRQGRFNTLNVRTVSSVDSDLPSLASSSTSEEGDDQIETSPKTVTSPIFADNDKTFRSIRFDPRVWVREFVRSKFECERIWFTPEEMDHFKTSAIQLIKDYNAAQSTELILNCTGRIVRIPTTSTNATQKALFSHNALSTLDCADAEESKCHPSLVRRAVAEHEIRNVLVVDPHEICRTLFTKSLKKILPHVSVTTVATSEEALQEISSKCCDHAKRGFDIVLVEEVLGKFDPKDIDIPPKVICSGSTLFRELTLKSIHMPCLHIGVTKDKDLYEERLYNGGADLVWSKPPPPANEGMRDQMLLSLLMKRGKHDMIGKLF